jgi:hypothetical protein
MLTTDEPQIQGCQIYTKTGKYTKWPQNVLIGQKMYQMAIIWTKIAIKYVHIPTSSNARPFKRYALGFLFENIPSGNHVAGAMPGHEGMRFHPWV